MRERFLDVVAGALDRDPRVAVVLAEIDVARLLHRESAQRHPRRVINVGIREQLMISVAGGLALEGLRPIVESYAPFAVERPFEQLKLDIGHQDVGLVLVSVAASYDAAEEGRTHQAPEDVALVASLPGWTVHVPGHADEAESLLKRAIDGDDRVYVRLSDETNSDPVHANGLEVLRRGSDGAPLVVAVGPTLDAAIVATADLDVTLAYLSTVRPFDAVGLRTAMRGTDVVLLEPYLAGTSAGEVADALLDRPHRLLSLGVRNPELRRYGNGAQHRAAHGLDAAGIGASLRRFLPLRTVTTAAETR
jgi:transketolase